MIYQRLAAIGGARVVVLAFALALACSSCGPLAGTTEPERFTVTVRGAGMLAPVTVGVRTVSGFDETRTLAIDGVAEFVLEYAERGNVELYLPDEDAVPCRFDGNQQITGTAGTQAFLVCLLADLQFDGPAGSQVNFRPDEVSYELSVSESSESLGLTAWAAAPQVGIRLRDPSGSYVADLVSGRRATGVPIGDAGDGTGGVTYLLDVTHPAPGWQRTYSVRIERAGPLALTSYVKPGDAVAEARFGYSLALSRTGDRMVVGAPFADSAGAAYRFVRGRTGLWGQVQRLQPVSLGPDDRFGHSAAISADGQVVAVGAPLADEGAGPTDSVTDSGAVYIFSCPESGSCALSARLTASDLGAGDQFGYSLALAHAGDVLLVGAPNADRAEPDPMADAGAVYLFELDPDGEDWAEAGFLTASNAGSGDGFGWSVALSADGGHMAVGAFFESGGAPGVDGDQSDDGTPGAGAVYTFARQGQNIVQEHYLKASNPGSGDNFGYSLALSASGATLAVASNQEDSASTGIDGDQSDNNAARSGALYVFTQGGKSWVQEAYIKASNTDPADNFGYSVALSDSGDTLLVGAMGESGSGTGATVPDGDNERADSGALYGFRRVEGLWSEVFFGKGASADAGDYLGWSVAMSGAGDVFAGGAWGESSAVRTDHTDNSARWAGAVHVFE